MQITVRLLIPAVAIVVALGCGARQHHAKAGAFPEGVLKGRKGTGTVALINAQPATQFVKVGDAGMNRSLHGNLAQWTDAAIEIMAEKLTAAGVTVTNESPKTLSLAIVDARMGETGGGWGFKCTISLAAEDADGLKSTFIGERGSASFHRVCDAAISESVANLLRDQRMLAYLGF